MISSLITLTTLICKTTLKIVSSLTAPTKLICKTTLIIMSSWNLLTTLIIKITMLYQWFSWLRWYSTLHDKEFHHRLHWLGCSERLLLIKHSSMGTLIFKSNSHHWRRWLPNSTYNNEICRLFFQELRCRLTCFISHYFRMFSFNWVLFIHSTTNNIEQKRTWS